MGGRGSSSGMRGGGGGGAVVAPNLSNAAITRDLKTWMNENSPMNFTTSAPETITVGGVEYRWIGGDTDHPIGVNSRYLNDYQAQVQNSRGEWPVIEIVMNILEKLYVLRS